MENIWKTYGKTWKIIIYIIIHIYIEIISKYGNIILILYRNNNIIIKIWKTNMERWLFSKNWSDFVGIGLTAFAFVATSSCLLSHQLSCSCRGIHIAILRGLEMPETYKEKLQKNLQITSNLDGKHTISLGLLGLPWVYHGFTMCMGTI